MSYVPSELRSYVASFLPQEEAGYGYRVLEIPSQELITEMLNLGIDPYAVTVSANNQRTVGQYPLSELVETLDREIGQWYLCHSQRQTRIASLTRDASDFRPVIQEAERHVPNVRGFLRSA